MDFDTFKEGILKTGKRFFRFHDCSMCQYKCGYRVQGDAVQYDNGCYCVTYDGLRNSSWDEFYYAYKSQNESGKKHLKEIWGIEE